jgi:thiamine-phosphate pyrophosphorylase
VSALAGRRLYLCTPDRPDLARFLRDCIGGGVDLVQLRDKDLDDRRLIERARLALEVCREAGVTWPWPPGPTESTWARTTPR